MELHFLDETEGAGWCPTCRAPTLVTREWAVVDENTLLIVERSREVGCDGCAVSVLV